MDTNYYLDFSVGIPVEIPDWIKGTNHLRLCVSNGRDENPYSLTDDYDGYDVYLIYVEDEEFRNDVIEANVDTIKKSDNIRRIICNVDIEKDDQVVEFMDVFLKKMNFIEHLSDGPNLNADAVSRLLEPGGEVVISRNKQTFRPPYFRETAPNTFIFNRDWEDVETGEEKELAAHREKQKAVAKVQQVDSFIVAQKKPVVSLPKKKPSKEDFFQVNVESDGNCFFYACWESARLQGISTLKDFALGQLRQTKRAVLSTDSFPVVDGADPLTASAQLLKGLDGLLEDKLRGLKKWKESDTLITTLANGALSNVFLNPRRYAQQHAFAAFMRAFVAASKEYKASLKNWKDLYETLGYDLVVDNIERDLSPHNSILYYDNTLPVKEAVSKFADAMPAAFALDTFVDRLYVSANEIQAVKDIFLTIGLNLNTDFEQRILPGLTIFAIKSGDHYVAGVPREGQTLEPDAIIALIQNADIETKEKADTQIRKDESELRGKTQHQNKTARDDKFRTHQNRSTVSFGGRNRTKKRRH